MMWKDSFIKSLCQDRMDSFYASGTPRLHDACSVWLIVHAEMHH